MKKFLMITVVLVFATISNTFSTPSSNGLFKSPPSIVSSKKITHKPVAADKKKPVAKVLDCDVTVDLSEQCMDGSVHQASCTTHFCTGIFPAPTECKSDGIDCPILPPDGN